MSNRAVNRTPRFVEELPEDYNEYVDVTHQFPSSIKEMGMYGVMFTGRSLLGGPELLQTISESSHGYVLVAEDRVHKIITFVRV